MIIIVYVFVTFATNSVGPIVSIAVAVFNADHAVANVAVVLIGVFDVCAVVVVSLWCCCFGKFIGMVFCCWAWCWWNLL